MHRVKRNSSSWLGTLGLPLRVTDCNVGGEGEEELNKHGELKQSCSQHTDQSLKNRRPSESLSTDSDEPISEAKKRSTVLLCNKENYPETPTNTFSSETPIPVQKLTSCADKLLLNQTPSSTYPNSLGIHMTNSVSMNRLDSRENTLKNEAVTPSSTFPISLPLHGGQEHQTNLPNTTTTSLNTNNHFSTIPSSQYQHSHLPPQFERSTAKKLHPCEGASSKCSSVQRQLATGCNSSVTSSHKESKGFVSASKPPPGQSSTRHTQGPEEQQCQTVKQEEMGDFSSPPGNNPEIVVMKSPSSEHIYRKLKLLGIGGSSKVFKVVGEDYQVYALKEVYIKHVDPAIKTAYVNEIKLLKKLKDKPEIITLHDFTWNKQEGILYILLEYAEMDLNAVIKRGNQSAVNPMASTLYFWNQMLKVVKVIHDEGVIHNDLKPENFVCIGAELRLIDFGISNRIEVEHTSIERDVRCGTINYMAPETIETFGDNSYYKVGRPSDVWSLGCILYQMVYGRTPFEHIRNKMKKWQAINDSSIAIAYPHCDNPAVVDILQSGAKSADSKSKHPTNSNGMTQNSSAAPTPGHIHKCLCRNPKERSTIDALIAHPFSRLARFPET